MIEWVFEIGSTPLRLSTKATTYGGNTYAAAIDPTSFAGVTMRLDISGSGLVAPNDLSFDVVGSYTASQFDGEFVVIRQIIDGSENRAWKFKITSALVAYGAIQCYAEHFLNEHLEGDWPNTPAPKEVWPSDDNAPDDDYCIPIILGSAYIPVRSVNTGSDRYYVLGVDSGTYTITKVKTPRRWLAQKEWASASYTMTQSTDSGYKLVQPIIDDQDDDGTADAVGLWPDGSGWMDMLCLYSNSSTSLTTSPADWLEYVLESFGVASADIDTGVGSTFETAETSYSGDSITFNGGFWRKQNRERILSNLLAQVDSFLVPEDDLKLYRFDKTSIETITNAQELTFRPRKVSKAVNDSGRVHWPESSTAPQDVLTGQKIVPIASGGTTASPTSTVLECKFLAGQSQNAQNAGLLYFQKMLGQEYEGSFSVPLSELTTKATICPGKVITLNNTFYGGSNDVIITELTLTREGDANIGFVKLETMNDWDDLTPSAVTIVADSQTGRPLEVPTGLDVPSTQKVSFKVDSTDIKKFKIEMAYVDPNASLNIYPLGATGDRYLSLGGPSNVFDAINLRGKVNAYGDIIPGSGDDLGSTTYTWGAAYIDELFVGGTTADNSLSIYEASKYTATLTCGSGTITLNSSYDTLSYTRIGRKVTVTGEIRVDLVSSPSGTLALNLPIAMGSLDETSETFCASILYGGLDALAEAGSLMIYGLSGATAYFVEQTTTGSSGSVADHVKSGSLFYFNFTYFTS